MTGRELYALSQSQGSEMIAREDTRACAVRVVLVVVVMAYGVSLREPSTSESMKGRVFLVFKFFCVE